jgi:hypothetical protein
VTTSEKLCNAQNRKKKIEMNSSIIYDTGACISYLEFCKKVDPVSWAFLLLLRDSVATETLDLSLRSLDASEAAF